MNTRPNGQTPGDGQSPLSLLVNAADSRDASQAQRDVSGAFQGQSLAETLRLRGFTSEPIGTSLEEQLFLQQQQQQQQFYGAPTPGTLLSQLRDHNLLSQLGGSTSQNNQLASLLGLNTTSLGAGAVTSGQGPGDIRSALAAAQFRQQQQHQPQLSHADILALSRTGALSGASNLLGGGVASATAVNGLGAPVPAPGGLASELESLQRLEELERRQRLMATGASPLVQGAAVAAAREASTTVRGPVIRDERIPGGHIPRPAMDISQSSKKETVPKEEEVDGAVEARCTVVPPIETNNTKEELEKTPGSVIVPCRARGMPMDHNFKTAYFVIPENVKHGEELICSYFACRNAGIKFRYCSHCKVPVAKRNLRKRHKHGGEEVPPLQGDADYSGGEDEANNKRDIPSQITAKRSSMDTDVLSSNSAESNEKEEIQQDLVLSSMRTLENTRDGQNAVAMLRSEDNPKISPERMERWAALLGRRPATKEGDMMSAWLMEVLAVSDLDTPLKPSEELNTKPTAEINESSAAAADGVAESAENVGLVSPKDSKKTMKEPGVAAAAKKKRPADLLNGDLTASGGSNTETFASGSFAAWKERKKQKKQAKTNPSQETEG